MAAGTHKATLRCQEHQQAEQPSDLSPAAPAPQAGVGTAARASFGLELRGDWTGGSERESAFGGREDHGAGSQHTNDRRPGSSALPPRQPPNGLLREHMELVQELPLPDPGIAATLRQCL